MACAHLKKRFDLKKNEQWFIFIITRKTCSCGPCQSQMALPREHSGPAGTEPGPRKTVFPTNDIVSVVSRN
jgi:hypothetical protein